MKSHLLEVSAMGMLETKKPLVQSLINTLGHNQLKLQIKDWTKTYLSPQPLVSLA